MFKFITKTVCVSNMLQRLFLYALVMLMASCGGGGGGDGEGAEIADVSITKTSNNTLSWTSRNKISCEITNDQNSIITPVEVDKLSGGTVLHGMPAATTFTLTCVGETSANDFVSVSSVDVNQFPNTIGYYGSASSLTNSWTAIANLTSPIVFTDQEDFNAQVDSYCTGLGFIGAVKTQAGAFSTNAIYYLQSNNGVIAGNGPTKKVTLTPGDVTYTNVYTNRRNDATVYLGYAGRATIGNNLSSISQAITSPTTGIDPMVLCQTDLSLQNSILIPQSISFDDVGPVNKLVTDAIFANPASTGLGSTTIIYLSSDTDVATVDSNGVVTLTGLGTTTITATKPGEDQFIEATTSYTLNVN